jgi:hypothetical protein
MQRWTFSIIGLLALASIGLTAVVVTAEPNPLLHVSVAFGRGLNTAQPGNPVNHVIIPDNIRVKRDGVVHFLTSGFHQLVVYKPGTEVTDIVVPPSPPPVSNNFILDPTTFNPAEHPEVYYFGINPAGGPLGTVGTTNPSNASNRVESVSFPEAEGRSPTPPGMLLSEKAEPGTYLVICNIRGHFLDGMYAYIKVLR